MGYTNETARLRLPQYVPEDKPTYLGDMNQAYAKIDETFSTLIDRINAQGVQLDGMSSGSALLAFLTSVDGSGSGLDSDTVDGKHASEFASNAALSTISNNVSAIDTKLTGSSNRLDSLTASITQLSAIIDKQVNRPYGRMVKNGYQPVTITPDTQGTEITFSKNIERNGVFFDSANGGGLRVTVSGLYEVSAGILFTGIAGGCRYELRYWRDGQQRDKVLYGNDNKPDGNDAFVYGANRVNLLAGDIIKMKGWGSSNFWGDGDSMGFVDLMFIM